MTVDMSTGVIADMAVLDRILARCVEDENGCWVWQGSRTHDGYGKVQIKGKNLRTHRLVFTILSAEIPTGLQLDHLCRVPACCNPSHLDPVTNRVNVARGKGAGTPTCMRGHPLSDQMRRTDGRGRRCAVCARIHRATYRLKPRHLPDRGTQVLAPKTPGGARGCRPVPRPAGPPPNRPARAAHRPRQDRSHRSRRGYQ